MTNEYDDLDDGFEAQVADMLARRANDVDGAAATAPAPARNRVVASAEERRFRTRGVPVITAAAAVLIIGLIVGLQNRGESSGETVTSVAAQPSAVPVTDEADPASTAEPGGTAVPQATAPAETSTIERESLGCILNATPPFSPCVSGPFLHQVEETDRLHSIADRYGVTIDAILRANPELDPNVLVIAALLAIPLAESERFFHTIEPGDTLAAIAKKYNVTVDAIVGVNPGLNPSVLRVGGLLVIPGARNLMSCPPGFPVEVDTNADGVVDTCFEGVGEGGVATGRDEDDLVYLPGGDWQKSFISDLFAPVQSGGQGWQLTLTTDEGVFGPVVWARFNIGVTRIDYGPSGGRITTTPAGTTVKVAANTTAASPLAIVEVEGGSVVASGYGVTESELLAVVDQLRFVDSALTWRSDETSIGLQVVEFAPSSPRYDQLSFRRGDEADGSIETLSLIIARGLGWQEALNARSGHPDAVTVEVAGNPGLAYGYSDLTRDDPGAVFVVGDAVYVLRVQRWGPNDPYATVEDVIGVLDTFAPMELVDLIDELNLVRRDELYTAWLADTPRPPDTDVSWLLDRAPTDPVHEASFAHQVFTCLWAGEWVETGDPLALDMIAASEDWPTAQVLRRGDGLPPGPTIEDPAATTRSERATPRLHQDCGFVLGSFDS